MRANKEPSKYDFNHLEIDSHVVEIYKSNANLDNPIVMLRISDKKRIVKGGGFEVALTLNIKEAETIANCLKYFLKNSKKDKK